MLNWWCYVDPTFAGLIGSNCVVGIPLPTGQMDSSLFRLQRRYNVGTMSLLVLCATLIADQLTKGLIVLTMEPGISIPQSGLIRLTHITNTGGAFGLLANETTFLAVASVAGIGVLLVFYRTQHGGGALLRGSIGLQLGGAIGNLVDRVRLGYVVDFIDIGAWPVFNLADSAITIGLIGLILNLVITRGSGITAPNHGTNEICAPMTSMEAQALDGTTERTPLSEETIPDRRDD